MKALALALAAAAGVAGCAPTQADLEKAQVSHVFRIENNYQQVYAQMNKGMRNCFTVGSMGTVDAQLYPELGYGEITNALQSTFSYSPQFNAKISRDQTGAVVQIKSVFGGRGRAWYPWMEHWAKGGIACPKILASEVPPPL